jgi:PPK2 family polyphosphate:nucleotide phosphotransferase
MKPIDERAVMKKLLVRPGTRLSLKNRDTAWDGAKQFKGMKKDAIEEHAKDYLAQSLDELRKQQAHLWANDTWSMLVVFQAMDAAGKDGAIEHVFSGVNPQGCDVSSFKQPSAEELDHDYLWRIYKALPARGTIGIFNRSHYEEVLVARVHPEIVEKQGLPPLPRGRKLWAQRYESINAFERHLARNGTKIVKFFLHVSKAEQKKRFLDRLDTPKKHWKFSAADVAEREHWGAYRQAYEDAISATSKSWAPWYVVPADHKWLTRVMVAGIITETIRSLKLKPPESTPEQKKALSAARRRLESE